MRYRGHGWGADSLVARYGYDVLGRRIARRVYWSPLPGAEARETRYLYQGGQVVAETDAAGAFKWKYTWGPGTDNLVGLQDSTGTQFYVVQDQLGSVRGLVWRDGTWVMSQRFTPYGQLLVRDSAVVAMPKGLHVGWTGRETDPETGLTFHRARYYSPELRRWTQEDPIGYGGGGNLYAYVGGAVLEGRDPSGLIRDCSGGACGNPHDWSGVWGLSGDGSDASGFGGGVGSYIEDDGYLEDLMDAMYGAARGKEGCYGQVCAVNQEEYERYKNSNLESRTIDEQRFPALAELLKPTRQLSSTEFAMLMGAAGIADAAARQSLLDHLLVGGRVGSASDWRAVSRDPGYAPRSADQYYGWYFLSPSVFTVSNRDSGALANCALHEYAHAVHQLGHGPGGAQDFANRYTTGRRICG